MFPRERVLLLTLVALAGLFAVTGFAARLNHEHQATLAQRWFARGVAALDAHHPDEAITDLRTALVYSYDNREYRFRLAQALAAAGRVREARAYFLNLWQDEPGNSSLNLQLARLASAQGDVAQAIRYYHNAIYGVWDASAEQNRRQTRFELAEFLLREHETTEAQAELIRLTGDLPAEPAAFDRVADMLNRAGAPARALDTYQHALLLDRQDVTALAGAGRVAFGLGDYRTARRYLAQAAPRLGADSEVRTLLETSDAILGIDPYQRGLSAAERRSRVLRAFRQAESRLASCLANAPPDATPALQALTQQVQKLKPSMRDARLRRDADLVDAAMDLVFQIEDQTERACGPGSVLDRALVIVGQGNRTAQ